MFEKVQFCYIGIVAISIQKIFLRLPRKKFSWNPGQFFSLLDRSSEIFERLQLSSRLSSVLDLLSYRHLVCLYHKLVIMARDFRPKGARSAPRDTASAKSTPVKQVTSSPAASKPSPKSTPSTANKKKEAYDSDDSADEATLMREIESFGGNRDDLDLISKVNGNKKSDVQIDEAAFSGEVAAFLKQLQSDPNASEPASSTPPKNKAKEVKPVAESSKKVDSKKQTTDAAPSKDKSKAKEKSAKQAEAKVQKPSKQSTSQSNASTESATVQRMGKGKKMVFDDDGVGKETKVKPSLHATGPLRLEAVPQWMSQTLPKLPSTNTNNDSLSHDRITQLLDMAPIYYVKSAVPTTTSPAARLHSTRPVEASEPSPPPTLDSSARFSHPKVVVRSRIGSLP